MHGRLPSSDRVRRRLGHACRELRWRLGLSFVPLTIAAVTGTTAHQAGLASGLINTTQQIGGALGLAILASVANSATADAFTSGVQDPAIALTEGFQDAFLTGAFFAIAGVVLTALLISSRDSRDRSAAAKRGELTTPAL